MDDANRPKTEAEAGAPAENGTALDYSGARRSRERRRRKVPPSSVKRNYLLHVLFYDRAFRWFAVAGILLFGSLGLMLPKIWVTSPPGVFPVIKVNVIDLLKARSLKQSAVAAGAAGKTEEAIQAWHSALDNNEADVDANRGLLATLAAQPKPDLAWLRLMAGTADWLLRLSATNQADLELACRANAAYGQWDWIVYRVGQTNAPRTEVTTPILLAALFEKGLMQRFGSEWAAHKERAQDQRTRLYVAAWTAGWGPAAEYMASVEALEAATKVPEQQELAYRMLLRVDYQRVDLNAYERHFKGLRETGGDKLLHHVRFWNLLRMSGQRSRAIELAQGFSDAPSSVDEAEQYLSAVAALQQARILQDFAKDRLLKFIAAPPVWVRTAEALIQVGEWDDLRSLAVEMRQVDRLNAELGNLSWFFEGVGEHHLGRRPRAEDAFQRYLEKPSGDTRLTFSSAVMMSQLGYPQDATRLLRSLETKAGNSSEFWRQMQQAAYESREVDSLIEASRRLYLLQASDPVVANNYAASLLLRGDRGPEAVKVTFEVLDRMPNSVSARVNRALALLQVGRVDEAGPLLASLAGAKLEPATAAVLHFSRFLFHEAKGQKAEAIAAAEKVEQRFLFPLQAEQLNASLAKLKGVQ
jgi:predicted Zn-dependent protease